MTITVTTDLTQAPPTNTITVSSGAGSVMSQVALYRNDPTGRVLTRTQPGPGFASRTVTDVECPYGVTSTYSWTATYVAPGTVVFDETWAALTAWTQTGGTWSVSGGKLRFTNAESTVATIQRGIGGSSLVRVVIATPPTGVQSIVFGSFRIDVTHSQLFMGSNFVQFIPGTGAWTIDATSTTASITTDSGTWAVTGTNVTMNSVKIIGTCLVPFWAHTSTMNFTTTPASYAQEILVDSTGNIWVSNNQGDIVKYSAAGTLLVHLTNHTTWHATHAPRIALDASDNLWLAVGDGNRGIEKYNSSGVYQSTVTYGGTAAATWFGFRIDSSGNFYAIDGVTFGQIIKISSTGTVGTIWGSLGTGNGQFVTSPKTIFMDASNGIWVSDFSTRLQKFNTSGTYQSTVTLTNSARYFGVVGNAIYAVFSSGTAQKFDMSANLLGMFGSPGTSDGQFSTAATIAGNATSVFVGDSTTRVQRFDLPVTAVDEITVYTYGATGTLTEQSAPVTVAATDGWAIHPITPSKSCKLGFSGHKVSTIRSLGDITNPDNSTLHAILGSATPISTVTGPRGDDQLQIVLSVTTALEEANLKAMLEDQTPILFNLPPAKNVGLDYGFYAVGPTTRARLGQLPNFPFKSYVLPLTKVQSPIASVVNTGWSWAQLLLAFPDWATIKLAYNTWADVFANNRNPGY